MMLIVGVTIPISCKKKKDDEALPHGSKGQKWTKDAYEYWYDNCSCRTRPVGTTLWELYPSNNGSKNCTDYYTHPCANN